jgi:hypothetical protein
MKRLAPPLIAVLLFVACGGDTPEDVGPSADPQRGLAQDRASQSDLRLALAVAHVYFSDDDDYSGFDSGCTTEANSCAFGEDVEPVLDWRSEASQGEDIVAVTLASSDEVVLTTISQSGEEFCIADKGPPGGGGAVRGKGSGAASVATHAACEALGPDAW